MDLYRLFLFVKRDVCFVIFSITLELFVPDTFPLDTEVLRDPENPEDDKGLDLGLVEFSFPFLRVIKEAEEMATLCRDMTVPPLDGGRLAEDDDVCARLVCR